MNFSTIKESKVDLENIRSELIRLEDTVIFSLIERTCFAHNPGVYKINGVQGVPGTSSFLTFFIHEMECVHAKVRRYTSPDEYPFSSNLPSPVLPPLEFPKLLHPNNVSVNDEILSVYINDIVPTICKSGTEDGNFGSAATKDLEVLQTLSRRIHFGKFVAEAKFNDPKHHDQYVTLIKAGDSAGILQLLTNTLLEQKLLRRLRKKALIYGQEIDDGAVDEYGDGGQIQNTARISPAVVAGIYEQFVIPLTKRVEVEYLLQRLV